MPGAKGKFNSLDGIAVDKEAGVIYFTNMKPPSVQRMTINGTDLTPLYAPAKESTSIFKQITLVVEDGKKILYWGDREGMKVWRMDPELKDARYVVDTSTIPCKGTDCKQAVGVAVDTKNGYLYWSQKGNGKGPFGSIRRKSLKNDSEPELVADGLPEPIDLKWVDGVGLYWTDRNMQQAGGQSISRLQMTPQIMTGESKIVASKGQVLMNAPKEGNALTTGLIGITMDIPGKTMWTSDLNGFIYSSDMSGRRGVAQPINQRSLGMITGIEYVE